MYNNTNRQPKYKARKHWLKNVIETADHMAVVSKILKQYAVYLDEYNTAHNISYVNDVVAYIIEIIFMFGDILNGQMDFPECMTLGAIINAFNDDSRPKEFVVKRIMKGIKNND